MTSTLFLSSLTFAGSGTGEEFKLPELRLKESKGLNSKVSNVEKLRDISRKVSYSKQMMLLQSGSINQSESINRNKFEKKYSDITDPKPFSGVVRKSDIFSQNYLNGTLNDHVYWESKRRFGVAVAEIAIVEFIPWAISKWITRPGWAAVGWQSWWSNIQHGWEYDGDNFLTNNFAHPYHGNLYYNTGRTNGYKFWESVPFAFSGSLLWEYFGEYYRPSFNDWLNTSISGVNLGEMTYRVSNLITDNTTRGNNRVWTEIFGALVNPVRGFNRLISGEASKVHPNTSLYNVPVNLFVDGGMRRVVERGSDFTGDSVSTEGLLGFKLVYGDRENPDLSTPFSRFLVWGHVSNGTSKLTDLFSYGLLQGWKLGGNNKNHQVFTVNLAYNFLTNPAFEFGGPGLLAMFSLKNMLGDVNFLKTDLGAYGIFMGSTPTEYFYGEDGRDYDFGPGPGVLLSTSITNGTWNYLTLGYQGFTIFTMSGSPESVHYLHNAVLNATLPINNYFAIGLETTVYWRNSFYKTEEDVSRTSPIARLFFVTKL